MQSFKSLPVSGTTLAGLRKGSSFEPVAKLVSMLLLTYLNIFNQASCGGSPGGGADVHPLGGWSATVQLDEGLRACAALVACMPGWIWSGEFMGVL